MLTLRTARGVHKLSHVPDPVDLQEDRISAPHGRDEFVTEFLERGLYGFYLAVTREGHVEAGDPIVALTRDPHRFGVNEVARLYARDRNDGESMRRAAELGVLPESWRDFFRKRVSSLAA
jgi:MOSC domain-containing protein YiiM